MTEVAMGGPTTPSPQRPKRRFPSFVQDPGIGFPPPQGRPDETVRQNAGAPIPTEKEALAAHGRYRLHPTDRDGELVRQWVAAAKGDPAEQARRIRLTA